MTDALAAPGMRSREQHDVRACGSMDRGIEPYKRFSAPALGRCATVRVHGLDREAMAVGVIVLSML